MDQDHLHCLVKSEPRISPLAIARRLRTRIDHSALAGARTGVEKILLEGKDIAVVMDTFVARLATPVRKPSASLLRVKGEGGVSSTKLKDFVVFTSTAYKLRVEEEIHMHMAYDWFIDANPDVQERVAKGERRGEARGEERGEVRGEERGKKKGLQQSALKIIHTRFPSLVEFAQTRVLLIDNREELDYLIDQLLLAPDEASARQLFR